MAQFGGPVSTGGGSYRAVEPRRKPPPPATKTGFQFSSGGGRFPEAVNAPAPAPAQGKLNLPTATGVPTSPGQLSPATALALQNLGLRSGLGASGSLKG